MTHVLTLNPGGPAAPWVGQGYCDEEGACISVLAEVISICLDDVAPALRQPRCTGSPRGCSSALSRPSHQPLKDSGPWHSAGSLVLNEPPREVIL